MSQFNDELLRRLACNALLPRAAQEQALADTRDWFMDVTIAHHLDWRDLSPAEQQFADELVHGFVAWRQSLN